MGPGFESPPGHQESLRVLMALRLFAFSDFPVWPFTGRLSPQIDLGHPLVQVLQIGLHVDITGDGRLRMASKRLIEFRTHRYESPLL